MKEDDKNAKQKTSISVEDTINGIAKKRKKNALKDHIEAKQEITIKNLKLDKLGLRMALNSGMPLIPLTLILKFKKRTSVLGNERVMMEH